MTLAAFFATAAQAQMSDRVLVSNIAQTSSGDHSRTEPVSQQFTTGLQIFGFALKSVEVAYRNLQGDSVSAKVCTVTDADQPTDTCTDFTGPASFGSGDITFTPPGGFMFLERRTKYAVVLTPDESNTLITYSTTSSNDEDSASVNNWLIADAYHLYDGTAWITDGDSRVLRIHLRGNIIQTGNTNARGAPGITGPAQVGGTLTAHIGDIADRDGLPTGKFPNGYLFQWIRVNSSGNGMNIAGATSDTYTPVTTDLGHTLKVRARFLDGGVTLETRTSAATNPVVPGAADCPAVSVWCTVLTAGSKSGGDVVGYRVSDGLGSLDDDTFSFDGSGYTVTLLTSSGSTAIDLNTAPLLPADGGGLTLHVQRLNGTLDLTLDAADGSPHDGSAQWNWNGAIDTGPMNPSLLRRFARFNMRYERGTDPGTRVTVWLSRQPGVSFDAPNYSAHEAGEDAPVTVTMTPAPTSSVTIIITTTGQDGATSADWSGIPSSLTFDAGESSKTFTVTAVEDAADDAGESVEIEFGTLPSGTLAGYRTKTTVHFFDRASPGELRLVGGNGLPTAGDEGRLQVFYQGQWGTICDDRMDGSFKVYDSTPPRTVETNHAPALACQLMGRGYTTGEVIDLGPYRKRNIAPEPIWLDDLRCEDGGTHWTGKPATRLDHCFHAGIGRDNCTHDEDVALRCMIAPMATVIEPLRVAFVDVPKTGHDGETAFTFGLDFSEAVAITAEDMRDHALDVSGATVTSAALADGRDDLWEFTLEPTGTDLVVITVSGKDSCTDAGALCTSLGAGLENRLSTVIPYVPAPAVAALTAEFLDVPDEHDGSSAFTVRLVYSEPVFDGTESFHKNRSVRDALSVSGGRATRAIRVDADSYDQWTITIGPTDHNPVTVTLPAGGDCATGPCTDDGRALSQEVSAEIQGPPGLSVADAEVEEGPDAKLGFVITLDRAATGTVSVDASTSDGTAVAGEDYRAKTLTKTFAPGEKAAHSTKVLM